MALVVKVKYENTLRRFNVYVREDGNPDLSLDGLRNKVCDLFQLNPNMQYVITYADEDNDIITMADDNDLLDALRQGLNPLRIQVSPTSQNNRNMERRSQSNSSTPRSLSIPNEHPFALNPRSICSDETLKLLPESVQKALIKLVEDCPALTSTSGVPDFLQGFIKLVATYLEPLMKSQQGISAVNGTGTNNNTPSFTNDTGEQGTGNVQAGSDDRAGPSAPPVGDIHDYVPKRNMGIAENAHRVFHKGIQCDSCGMHPIVGPRYKSMVKDDYDLCHACFCEAGNEEEYTRIDRALYRPPRYSRERYIHGRSPFHKLPFSPPFSRTMPYPCPAAPSIGKLAGKVPGKLDCRFVQDVTIFDGTQLAPGTPFTKIWRLRNNGTAAWPNRTQLVRVGGDDLGAGNSVNLEIQEQGYPIDEELDAAIDFIAPMQPGRYISYWRLMAPSGQKFGQRVWVLIQVETQKADILPHLMESLLTLKDVDQNNPSQEQTEENEAGDGDVLQDNYEKPFTGDNKMNLDPQGVLHTELGHFSMVENPEERLPLYPKVVDETMQGINESTEVQVSSSKNTEAMSSALGASYSLNGKSVSVSDASAGNVAMPVSAPFVRPEVSLSLGGSAKDVAGIEQNLLHELEDMGFKHKGLNAELLRKNNYDIQKTLDDLCGAAEWDPILEELQEMGFHDTEMNKRLLVKNEGSVKRVVLDLLSAEKDISSIKSHLSKKAKQS